MKKSIFLDHLLTAAEQENIPFEDVLSKTKALGYVGVEVPFDYLESDTLNKVLAADFKVASVVRYMHFEKLPLQSDINSFFQKVTAVDCKTVMIVPEFSEGIEQNEDFKSMFEGLNLICDIAKEYGITVTMEDYDNIDIPCGGIENLSKFFENVPDLSHAFDTGNYAYFDDDVLTALSLFGDKITHVHVKDRADTCLTVGDEPNVSVSGKKLYPAPVGEGNIPLKSIMEQLKRLGYSGYLSAEHFGAKNQMDYIQRSAKGLDMLINKK